MFCYDALQDVLLVKLDLQLVSHLCCKTLIVIYHVYSSDGPSHCVDNLLCQFQFHCNERSSTKLVRCRLRSGCQVTVRCVRTRACSKRLLLLSNWSNHYTRFPRFHCGIVQGVLLVDFGLQPVSHLCCRTLIHLDCVHSSDSPSCCVDSLQSSFHFHCTERCPAKLARCRLHSGYL